MKPSRKKSRKKRKPSAAPPPGSGAAVGGSFQSGEEEREDVESRALNWLIEVFGSVSLDQITSAYHEAGRDAYKAAGILGAHLIDPEEDSVMEKKKRSTPLKQKRVAVATGMVSDVIGKGYSNTSVRLGRRRSDACQEAKGPLNQWYSPEEGEQFLCSMLGDNSELGMGVVRDVLGQYGHNVEKALDALLEISASSYIHFREKDPVDYWKGSMDHSGICPEISNNSTGNIINSLQLTDKTLILTHCPSKREHEILDYEGNGNRGNRTNIADSAEQEPSGPGMVKADLQQKVLNTLFNIRDLRKYEPKYMNWKKVVQKVESFGQGLEFSLTSITESPQNIGNGKGSVYEEFRSVSRKHWDEMRNFYQKAAAAYSKGERAYAAYLSEKGKYYSRLAREADEKASREIFEARNKEIKNTVTIDLHGQHVKQAVGLLKLHLLLFTYIPSIHFLKVITGCGADGVGKGRLKHSVIGLVEKEGIAWSKENAGTLILQLGGQKEYSFTECDNDSD